MLTRLDAEVHRIQGSVRNAIDAMHAQGPVVVDEDGDDQYTE
jgi:hypothetical protein